MTCGLRSGHRLCGKKSQGKEITDSPKNVLHIGGCEGYSRHRLGSLSHANLKGSSEFIDQLRVGLEYQAKDGLGNLDDPRFFRGCHGCHAGRSGHQRHLPKIVAGREFCEPNRRATLVRDCHLDPSGEDDEHALTGVSLANDRLTDGEYPLGRSSCQLSEEVCSQSIEEPDLPQAGGPTFDDRGRIVGRRWRQWCQPDCMGGYGHLDPVAGQGVPDPVAGHAIDTVAFVEHCRKQSDPVLHAAIGEGVGDDRRSRMLEHAETP